MGNATEVKSKYPELDKLSALKGKTQTLGEFLEWMGEQGLFLARNHKHNVGCVGGSKADLEVERGRLVIKPMSPMKQAQCGYSENDMEYINSQPNAVIATFFGLDEDKMEEERRSMLAGLQNS